MLLPTISSTSATTVSTGPTATIPRDFVRFAYAADTKPHSKSAFWSSYTSMSTSVSTVVVFTYQAMELDVMTHVNQGHGVTITCLLLWLNVLKSSWVMAVLSGSRGNWRVLAYLPKTLPIRPSHAK